MPAKTRSPTIEHDSGIVCPSCGRIGRHWVVDSRPVKAFHKRRRECVCGFRFNTYESTEYPPSVKKEYTRADYLLEIRPKLVENIKKAIIDSFKEET